MAPTQSTPQPAQPAPTSVTAPPRASVLSQKMYENLKKFTNFMATLRKLSSHVSPEIAAIGNSLVQDLLHTKIEPEEFANRLHTDLMTPPHHGLVPFLKESLRALKLSLQVTQQTLQQEVQPQDGRTPPANVAGPAKRHPNSVGTTGALPAGTPSAAVMKMQENVKKCKKFLVRLVKRANQLSPPSEIADIVQDMLDAKIEPEEFASRLHADLMTPPYHGLVPFLKETLPALRLFLLISQQSLLVPLQQQVKQEDDRTPPANVAGPAGGVRHPNSVGTTGALPAGPPGHPAAIVVKTEEIEDEIQIPPQSIREQGEMNLPAQISTNQRDQVNDPEDGSFSDKDHGTVHCLICYEPQDMLLAHLGSVCMKNSTPEERLQELQRAKESMKKWIRQGRTWNYNEMCKRFPDKICRHTLVSDLWKRGFFVENAPNPADMIVDLDVEPQPSCSFATIANNRRSSGSRAKENHSYVENDSTAGPSWRSLDGSVQEGSKMPKRARDVSNEETFPETNEGFATLPQNGQSSSKKQRADADCPVDQYFHNSLRATKHGRGEEHNLSIPYRIPPSVTKVSKQTSNKATANSPRPENVVQPLQRRASDINTENNE